MKTIIMSMVILFSFSSFANQEDKKLENSEVSEETFFEYCNSISELGKIIMNSRQRNIPLSKILELSGDELSKSIAIAAYKKPFYNVEENKNNAAIEFSNDILIECIESR
ncbi:hypothetical protein OGN88_002962 [Vibrio cholerae]|nr:hypothetical protein [Vibrio cholerae]